MPDLDLIVEMADFFDTSVDVLIGSLMKDNRLTETVRRLREYRRMKENRLRDSISCLHGVYALGQVLCAFVGLLLGFVLVILIQKPDLGTVIQPFGVYLLAHLAACAVGSGVFAWLCARKHVLAQLQAKE